MKQLSLFLSLIIYWSIECSDLKRPLTPEENAVLDTLSQRDLDLPQGPLREQTSTDIKRLMHECIPCRGIYKDRRMSNQLGLGLIKTYEIYHKSDCEKVFKELIQNRYLTGMPIKEKKTQKY